ncbi:hypothetical protein TL16_g11079 [Triparma laevis f. inornata]|uniref:Fibronectin type-III domain-containing protein n=1 Tax=Triparma laevis f. inornata TaxID=1714386 RepID=A0A9W7ESF0_9STRA|nr:hypothetical protein TL16_g11079 [Triparma laevis f. inornata]
MNATEPLERLFNSTLTQLRLYPAISRAETDDYPESEPPVPGSSFIIDWLRLQNSPTIERVTGCNGEIYSDVKDFENVEYEVEGKEEKVNGYLSKFRTEWERRRVSKETTFAKTYNCLRHGGDRITIEGRNLGTGASPAIVYIGSDKNPCTYVIHDEKFPQSRITCITPACMTENCDWTESHVWVLNGKLPGLNDTVPFFKYAEPAPPVINLAYSNLAARSFDLNWTPGGSIWDAMSVTGYRITVKPLNGGDQTEWIMQVGNVTTTTVRNLYPNVNYRIKIQGTTENQNDPEWKALDLYGRRELIDGGVIGEANDITLTTLEYDLEFTKFNAEMTLNAGAVDPGSTLGPTGVTGGEGHYGLYLIGDANIENCNSSVVCCDDWPICTGASYSCSSSIIPDPRYESGEVKDRRVPDNLVGGEKWVKTVTEMNPVTATATMKCGPALRLTASSPRLSGAAWYQRQLEVNEGFDTTFTYRIANPSLKCDVMDDVYTKCRSRGADGFAFVIQNDSEQALGGSGSDLGYGGIINSFAVEFDTYYNPELLEPYENHISVHTRGHRATNSAHQSYSTGSTSQVRDLTDGDIEVRLKYSVDFDSTLLDDPNFLASPYMSNFLENADFENGGMADWSTGMGTLQVYVENLVDPVLVVPLNLDATINLNHGRAWVGFTSATGFNSWQVHDILEWRFKSLREDKSYLPPPIVNGEGAHMCSGVAGSECRHD